MKQIKSIKDMTKEEYFNYVINERIKSNSKSGNNHLLAVASFTSIYALGGGFDK